MTSHHPNDNGIQALWTWFKGVSISLARDFENEKLLDQLDDRVSAIGEITWELGPGRVKECALTLTPDGAPEWLSVTQRAVAMTPDLPEWEFYPARQKKNWELQFEMETSDGRVIDVDARLWRYTLVRFPQGRFKIVLEQTNLSSVEETDRYLAAVIVLDGILGEAARLLFLESVEPVARLSPEHSRKANPIAVLANHLDAQ